jgi:NADP-dependent 3-hydroxy acid dehydrogenase YdfG
MKEPFMPSKILLTGASGGFGQLIAQTLRGAGHQVAATMRDAKGRNQAVAQTLAARGAHVVEMDVTQDASVEAGVAQASQLLGGA